MRLVIHGESDTPGKKDFSRVFLPEAKAFLRQGVTAMNDIEVSFNNKLAFAKRWPQLKQRLEAKLGESGRTPLGSIAIFCHGWADGIQAGLTRRNVKQFVSTLLESRVGVVQRLHVLLYCCSTGDDPDDDAKQAPGSVTNIGHAENLGEGSFADTLRDELCKAGVVDCRVVAHRTAGHATENPYGIFFDGHGSNIGGVGGYMPVTPANKVLWRKWVAALKIKSETNFRFEYPYMSVAEIQEHLTAQR